MELEFQITDVIRIDPVLGATPLIRANVRASIGMPRMPGMPKFDEEAHAEGIAGDYGVHPTFAHGGEYLLHVSVRPLSDPPFSVDFPLTVGDAQAAKNRKKLPPAYRLQVIGNGTPKAGEPAELQLSVLGRENPKQALTNFDVAHERLVHLLIVRADLGTFSHEHPTIGPGGVFRVTYTFPSGGDYHLFADVAPKGAGSQILMAKLKVAGKPGDRYDISQAPVAAEVVAGDLRVVRETSGVLPAMKTIPIVFDLTDTATGKSPADLEPYLGAMGHLLMVEEDGVTFVHSHPDETASDLSAGTVSFLARMPKPGRYRAWAQFQRAGTVRTASFIIEAQ